MHGAGMKGGRMQGRKKREGKEKDLGGRWIERWSAIIWNIFRSQVMIHFVLKVIKWWRLAVWKRAGGRRMGQCWGGVLDCVWKYTEWGSCEGKCEPGASVVFSNPEWPGNKVEWGGGHVLSIVEFVSLQAVVNQEPLFFVPIPHGTAYRSRNTANHHKGSISRTHQRFLWWEGPWRWRWGVARGGQRERSNSLPDSARCTKVSNCRFKGFGVFVCDRYPVKFSDL